MRFLILRMVTRNGDIHGVVAHDVDGRRLDGDIHGVMARAVRGLDGDIHRVVAPALRWLVVVIRVAHAVGRRDGIECRKVGNIRDILRVRNQTLFGGEWRYGPRGRFASWFRRWIRRR